MKRVLNESQMTELRRLGYMKDASLAGLIEFRMEKEQEDGIDYFAVIITPEIVDRLFKTTKKILEMQKA